MGKTKVILDTNILISALGWKGNPRKIFNKVIQGEIEFVSSDEQFAELSKTLDYPKFGFTEEHKDRFKSLILETATFVKPLEKLDVIKKDPADNRILEAAIAGNVNYIVTGDNHLLELKEFKEIKIIRAKDFLDIIKSK